MAARASRSRCARTELRRLVRCHGSSAYTKTFGIADVRIGSTATPQNTQLLRGVITLITTDAVTCDAFIPLLEVAALRSDGPHVVAVADTYRHVDGVAL